MSIIRKKALSHLSSLKMNPLMLVMLQGLFLIVLLGGWMVASSFEVPIETQQSILNHFLVALFIWSLISWRSQHTSAFEPYTIFIISFFLFNVGHPLLQPFGLDERGILDNRFSPYTTLQTTFFSAVCLTTFHFGALLTLLWNPRPAAPLQQSKANLNIVFFGLALLAVSFIPTILHLQHLLKIVMSGGYFSLYEGEKAKGFDTSGTVLSFFFVPSLLFIISGTKHKGARLLCALGIMFYCGVFFMLGKRWVAISPLLGLSWLWNARVKRLPLSILVPVGCVFLFVVFPLVSATRNIPLEERLSLETLTQAFSEIESPAVSAVKEMGGSMITTLYSMQHVPDVLPHLWGSDYFYALLTPIPNIFGGTHPAYVGNDSKAMILWAAEPWRAKAGGGLGFSPIAESYFNFGAWGGPVIMTFWGILIAGYIRFLFREQSAISLAVLASFLSFLPMFARDDTRFLIRSVAWFSIIPYVICWVQSLLLTPNNRLESFNLPAKHTTQGV